MAVKEFRLQKRTFDKAVDYIKAEGRAVDVALYEYYFQKASAAKVVDVLRGYVNTDGGFGQGIELDYLYTGTTPLSTTLGLQVLRHLHLIGNFNIISDALDYLYGKREKKAGWHCVTEEVNTAPRAPWWHYDKRLLSDFTLNPTAEIVGYFYHFGGGEYRLFVNELLDLIKDHLKDERNGNDMHEIICLMRMVRLLPDSRGERYKKYLKTRVEKRICLDQKRWYEYVLSPLMLFESPHDPLYDTYMDAVQENLNFLIDTQRREGYWQPNWRWGDGELWEVLVPRIRAHVTLRNLILLKNFNRLR